MTDQSKLDFFQKLPGLPFAQDLSVDGRRLRVAGRLLVPQLHLSRRNRFRFRLLAGDSGKNLDRTFQPVRQKTRNSKNHSPDEFDDVQGERGLNGLRHQNFLTKFNFFLFRNFLFAFLPFFAFSCNKQALANSLHIKTCLSLLN